jgi:GTP cyclohydrolase I
MTATAVTPLADRRVHEAATSGGVDVEAAEAAAADMMRALGMDPSAAGFAETPRRVARAYAELLTLREFTLTTFSNDEQYDELVLAREISFTSLCEHHLLPFTGTAAVGYLPGPRILGLSKLARVVELFCSPPPGPGTHDEADR